MLIGIGDEMIADYQISKTVDAGDNWDSRILNRIQVSAVTLDGKHSVTGDGAYTNKIKSKDNKDEVKQINYDEEKISYLLPNGSNIYEFDAKFNGKHSIVSEENTEVNIDLYTFENGERLNLAIAEKSENRYAVKNIELKQGQKYYIDTGYKNTK